MDDQQFIEHGDALFLVVFEGLEIEYETNTEFLRAPEGFPHDEPVLVGTA